MFSISSATRYLLAILLTLTTFTSAERTLSSTSLVSCQANSAIGATQFDVTLYPDSNVLSVYIVGSTTITGYIAIDLTVDAYGLDAYTTTLYPCQIGLKGMCPMSAGSLNLNTTTPVPGSALKQVPSIAYTVPDLDASVQLRIKNNATGEQLACVQANLSNGKTVYQAAVCWVLAIIIGLALIAAAVAATKAESISAAAVAADALALFGYFQSQAMLGMLAVPLPPITASWFQNFEWSMGIINVGFVESIATWYQRSTGGTPATLLSSLSAVSVQLEKRTATVLKRFVRRSISMAANALQTRATTDTSTSSGTLVLHGIDRVGFRAGIEITNIFLTSYIFFIFFVALIVIAFLLTKLICDLLVKSGKKHDSWMIEIRQGWRTTLKGVLYRVAFISFPQLVVMGLWELTVQDSPAEMALAVLTVISIVGLLGWASVKVLRMAHRAKKLGASNLRLKLFNDAKTFNKWGFLYVQYDVPKNYSVFSLFLVYIFVKAAFVAFGQGNGTVQAFAFVVIELAALIFVCVKRPFWSKMTDIFNGFIFGFGLFNAILFIFFTGITHVPGLAIGIMGVLVFVFNAIFALVTLIMLMVSSIRVLFFGKKFVFRDDRGSFITQSSENVAQHDELGPLGVTARGVGRDSSHGSLVEKERAGMLRANSPGYEKQGLYTSSPYQRSDSHSPSPMKDDDGFGYHSPNAVGDRNGNIAARDYDHQGVGFS